MRTKANAEHQERLAAMRAEHKTRMAADKTKHQEFMGQVNAHLQTIQQRNREDLLMWIDQRATDEQIVAIIGRIQRGDL